MFYNVFDYDNLALSGVALKPPSGSYAITTGPVAQAKEGQPAFLPMNSSVVFFDEKSICYACIVDAVTSVDVATSCKIQISGVKYTGTSVTGATEVQELVYNPALLPVGQSFNCTTFGTNFLALFRVDVVLLSAVLPNPEDQVVPLLDSNAYTAYFKS